MIGNLDAVLSSQFLPTNKTRIITPFTVQAGAATSRILERDPEDTGE